jgi:glutaredoxin
MMISKNILILLLISSVSTYGFYQYSGSTTAPVILAGAVVKHMGAEIAQKYKRKDCPVCKGTGKYLSGDGIKMVDCGYCELEKTSDEPSEVTHPPVILKSDHSRTRVIRK